MRINRLEPRIFNKIAAGEVVERPASIVKELVENSIDAGATMVTIKIENGGIGKINITDNGCGINFDDLEVAFLPHATSKIKTDNDLFGIKTLGFRGEALASISAVSEVVLLSKEPTAENGGTIEISGGVITKSPEVAGCADGTDITISNLFFNVPARAKFLKKPKTEEAEITSLVAKFILANPMVSFKYIVDGKIKYLSSGKGMSDALFVVYGKEVVDNTLSIDADFGYIKIYGFIGTPTISKPNRTYQTIIVNNRVVENITISTAVQNAYGEMLMKKQFPLFVLYVDLDYEMIDVNVHPNKKEIRFEDGRDIYIKVYEVINRKLNNLDCTRQVVKETEEEKTLEPESSKSFNYEAPKLVMPKIRETTSPLVKSLEEKARGLSEVFNNSRETNKAEEIAINYSEVNNSLSNQSSKEEIKRTQSIIDAMGLMGEQGEEKSLADGVRVGSQLLEELTKKMDPDEQLPINNDIIKPATKYIGSIFNTYIIIERGSSIYFIDQHAGHERLLFDKLTAQVRNNRVETQALLAPFVLTINAQEMEYITRIKPMLENLGFIIEDFGGNSIRIEGVPYLLASLDIKTFFSEILSDVKSFKTIEITDIMRDKLASLACKSAVKGGDELSENEVEKLLLGFENGNNRLLCPHGRPVVIEVSQKELEKWFKRIV